MYAASVHGPLLMCYKRLNGGIVQPDYTTLRQIQTSRGLFLACAWYRCQDTCRVPQENPSVVEYILQMRSFRAYLLGMPLSLKRAILQVQWVLSSSVGAGFLWPHVFWRTMYRQQKSLSRGTIAKQAAIAIY